MPTPQRSPIPDRATFYFPRFASDPRYGLHLMREIDYSCYAGSSVSAKDQRLIGGPASPGRFYLANITLRNLINYAYDMREVRILGGPDWVGAERWEVSAKADRVPPLGEMRAMVQHLMAERFGLKTHLETRDLSTYDLVFARGDGRLGSNMKPATVDCEPFRSGQLPMPALDAANDIRRRCGIAIRWGGGVRTMHYAGTPPTRLAKFLETSVERVIVDKTGLTGSFDVELTYEDEEFRKRFPGPGKQREAPSLFTALQEQLGLKLESSRGPVEVLVIDSAERPTPD